MSVEGILNEGFVTTSLDKLINWTRTGSMWPMTFGLACCSVVKMPSGAAPFPLAPLRVLFPTGPASWMPHSPVPP